MRKFILLAAAAICTLSLNSKTIYLNTGGGELWNQADPVFFAHTWSTPEDNADVKLNNVGGDIFSAEINDNHGNILFVRMPSGSTAVNWDTKWNQTADLVIPDGQNQYNITGWGPNDGNWSVYGGGGEQGGGDQGGGGGSGGGGDVSDHYYYYKGYIDGADIETYMEGVNGFTKGKASFSCSSDSYIFVVYQVHGAPGVEFAWQGEQAAEESASHQVTLIKAPSPFNKVHFAPGNYTLYLYEGDTSESLILATVELPGKKLVDADGEAIENVEYHLDVNAPMYDLLGRQVSEDYHGIVIQNGHKFIR